MTDTSSLGGKQGTLQCASMGLPAVDGSSASTSPRLGVRSASVFCQSCVSKILPTGIFGVFPTPLKDLETAKFRLLYRKRDLVCLVISMDKLAEQGS